jgi:hypothetical protein
MARPRHISHGGEPVQAKVIALTVVAILLLIYADRHWPKHAQKQAPAVVVDEAPGAAEPEHTVAAPNATVKARIFSKGTTAIAVRAKTDVQAIREEVEQLRASVDDILRIARRFATTAAKTDDDVVLERGSR